MPESKVRKQAAQKKVAKNKAQTDKQRSKSKAKARLAGGTRDWVPWVFIPVGLLGVLWLLVFYVAGNRVPGMQDLDNWNYLIGIGLIAASFGIATLWK
ncbi:cell division protein CrgA [Propionimicrobium sp. PCR01-08-3]|uniref:cell division protein CrgA n=1 Tax=Propionimicrobium sp. PCR01-08-3 TaxID=3052086 RepID=UPI00255D0372|nr:cell division protein CrgA [Propionimicrobium sp. PCR01-08-3]WIY82766.1 cell division protein CrgA [Propionimicrobium sp. PCR01-08-3]